MTVDGECDSPKGGVTNNRKVCQFTEKCDGNGAM